MKKYYAVKVGRNKGIYESWEACKSEVHGYQGAIYKSFNSLDDAKSFLDGENNHDNPCLISYVDGSYNEKEDKVGYGIVIIKDNEVIDELNGSSREYTDHRNVTGEILATMNAIRYAIHKREKCIKIYYDYEGIRSWALGYWKAKKDLTKGYKSFFDRNKEKIDISFSKVLAHSGVKYNELADKLAKEASGIE